MECITCRNTNVLNRVVVNQLTKHKHGLFCVDCETQTFGQLLDDPTWHQDHGCAFCDGNGQFVLPELNCIIERDNGRPRLIEHAPLEDAVKLCETHLEELLHTETTIHQSIEA